MAGSITRMHIWLAVLHMCMYGWKYCTSACMAGSIAQVHVWLAVLHMCMYGWQYYTCACMAGSIAQVHVCIVRINFSKNNSGTIFQSLFELSLLFHTPNTATHSTYHCGISAI